MSCEAPWTSPVTSAATPPAEEAVSLVAAAGVDGEARFTVVRDGLTVGWIRLAPHGSSLRLTGDVRPEARGNGVGTAAVRCACEVARSCAGHGSVRTLQAEVPPSDGAAQRVLEANGFTCADVTGDPLVFALRLPDVDQGAG
jgi:GNAT superfamily N-acetyltransferase